jgi:hypothetical protein
LLRSANYRITDDQFLDDIRYAARRTSGHLSVTVYDRERRLVYLESKAAGRPRALAGVSTIHRRFRTWSVALNAAGIDAARREPAQTRRGSPRINDDQLLRALGDAYATTGARLTVDSYAAWREGYRHVNPRDDESCRQQ